jgi:NADH-quinone oxidoreductase subunit D
MSEYVIPIGPLHPMLEEPEHFRISVKGEKVIDVWFKMGYVHRGVEYLCERKTWSQNIYLISRICSICTEAHSLCYCQTVEKLAKVEIPSRAKYIRTIIAELNRIESHLLIIGIMAHVIGYQTAFMMCWAAREEVMGLLERITGNRVQYSMDVIGGVRKDLREKELKDIINSMKRLQNWMRKINDIFEKDFTIKKRLKDVGVLTKDDVFNFDAVGPTARGSGVAIDYRKIKPYAAYDEIDFEVIVNDGCDAMARTLVRVMEVNESIKIINQACNNIPNGPISLLVEEIPKGESMGRIEAPRGELLYYIKSRGIPYPERVKIRTPTLTNIASLPKMLIGYSIADVPPIIASIDPCFSCADRIEVIESEKGIKMNLTEFLKYSKGDKK